MKHILFVCTGNTCRSSMAEGIFNDAVSKDSCLKDKTEASSAGIAAFDGEPASEKSIYVLKNIWGIDISNHRARRLTEEHLNKAYLVLTMTRRHREVITDSFPRSKGKVFTLKEYIQTDMRDNKLDEYNFGLDIIDPYGMPIGVYTKCGEEIREAVEKLIIKIKKELCFDI